MLFTIVKGAVPNVNCSVSQCDDGGPIIHFPFWLKQSNSTCEYAADCGYMPGFQLSGGKLYKENDTILELQHLVNSSIKGLQLSFIYKAAVSFIDYTKQEIHLYDAPYLTSIVPTPVLLNSSSTPHHLPSNEYYFLYDNYYIFNYHFYCHPYEDLIRDPFLNCDADTYC